MVTSTCLILGLTMVAQAAPLPHLDTLTDGLHSPVRLASMQDGSILVTDAVGRQVVRFDSTGQRTGAWSVPAGPIGVAVHPDGRIFVSCRDEPSVAIFNPDFQPLGYLGAGDPQVSFAGPTDLDIATDTGRIYVVDAEGNQVYGFNSDGSLAMLVGTQGHEPGAYLYPSAVAVDETRDRLIIADHDMYRLQVFSTGGALLFPFGSRLTFGSYGQGFTPRPQGVAVDGHGQIYVTDALMSTVRLFDAQGVDLGTVVAFGDQPGELKNPCDIALSTDGTRVYVANVGAGCVEVYEVAGMGRIASAPTAARAKTSRGSLAFPRLVQGVRNGPHLDADRLNFCQPCHGINGQPGASGGTVDGQSMLCISCHNAGGRALGMFIHHDGMADPYGTNIAQDGMGTSHAWGVPAVREGEEWTRPGPPMSAYLAPGDIIKCATCHNQHDTETFGSYLRASNDGDAMCKSCHEARVKAVGEPGSHPVGIDYPGGIDGYPHGDALGPLKIKEGRVECMTCHDVHNADSGGANDGAGDGMLLRQANDETLCQACHTQHTIHHTTTDWQPTCSDCHDVHDVGSASSALIARTVDGVSVTFTAPQPGDPAPYDYVHGATETGGYDGICEACHTATDYHQNTPAGNHSHYTSLPCTTCHLHEDGFAPMDNSCVLCHGEPPTGGVSPDRDGAHTVHMSALRGPHIEDCETCHKSQTDDTHDNGVVNFATGEDLNGDGMIDLSETDVCDTCHSPGGSFDGVDNRTIGAKPNWYTAIYHEGKLREGKADWCLGCHDGDGAVVHDVTAPDLAGDNRTWGYNIGGHGASHVRCTACHNAMAQHSDGVAMSFSLRFPLCPDGRCPPQPERELDRKAFNASYRLRRVNGQRALEIPRDESRDPADDFRLCLACHDKLDVMGVPTDYEFSPVPPPASLLLPAGSTPKTDYRNELMWGYGWYDRPANAHWQHLGEQSHPWDCDQDGVPEDSAASCSTCHNPHGARRVDGEPTIAMTVQDLNITHGIYFDGEHHYEYGYIGGGGLLTADGDLHCAPCHRRHGPGVDPPHHMARYFPRYYRKQIVEWPAQCWLCHE